MISGEETSGDVSASEGALQWIPIAAKARAPTTRQPILMTNIQCNVRAALVSVIEPSLFRESLRKASACVAEQSASFPTQTTTSTVRTVTRLATRSPVPTVQGHA